MSACGHASGRKREARRAREASKGGVPSAAAALGCPCGGGTPREKRKRLLRHGTAVAIVAAVGLLYERGVTPVAQAVVAAQPSIADPPTHVVHIDAIALDGRGRVVDDLKPADFELREDEALRPVESAQFIRATGARRFAIFLDEYHVSPGAATERVGAALTRFVDQALGPQDLLVVMKPLDSLFAIHLTGDREAARRAIASFEGRKGDYEARNAYERNYIAGTPASIEVARAQVALSAMNALAIQLGTDAEGSFDAAQGRRKTLVVVTEGIARSERRRGQDLPTVDAVVRSANRATVSIYPLDPREPSDDPSDTTRMLAADTDGQTIAGDLDAGLRRVTADASAYYLLTYRAAHPEDGKFHDVRVRAKRAGVTLRARKGYWAPSPDDALRAAVLARLNEPRKAVPLEPMRHSSPLIRQWFGAAKGDGGNTRVTIVWEPAARVPGDRSRRYPSRVQLTALAADGRVLFEGPLQPTGPAAMDEQGTTPSRAVFEAAPGRVRLRMSIQDMSAQVLDSDVRDLTVPDFRKPVAIGTPEILRARNARDFRRIDDDAAVPVASREFSRAERLLIRFPAYGPADAVPALSAKLLNRMGQTMRELSVAPAPTPSGANEIDLPLAGLANGEYLIELTAKSPAGEAKDRINFRVTS
jgi:VWFA-related protein